MFEREVQGMRDYREKDVDGYIADISIKDFSKMARKCKVTVRMTNDDKGQSLSLSAFNIQIGIPLESVADIVKVVEK